MVLLPKKYRTHNSRPKRCSQKILQTRLLYTSPLKMYQYLKYSNSLLFPFDRCRPVASVLLISEVQTFLQKPSSIIIIFIFILRSNQCFWLRSGPITLQEITYPDLVVAQTVHYLVFFPCHITKTFNPPDSPSSF